jgi:hypothetical protein
VGSPFVHAPAPAPAVVAATPFLSLPLPLLLLPPLSFLLPLLLLPLVLPHPFPLLPLPPLLRSHSHSRSAPTIVAAAAAVVSAAAAAPTPVFALVHAFVCANLHYLVILVGPSFGLRSFSFVVVLCPLVCLAFVRVCSCSFVLFWALMGPSACLLFMSTSNFTKLVNA